MSTFHVMSNVFRRKNVAESHTEPVHPSYCSLLATASKK